MRRLFSVGIAIGLFYYAGRKILPVFSPSLMPQPHWKGKSVMYVPGNLPTKAKTMIINDWTLEPLVDISQKGRVLGVEHYRFDTMASLCPYDIAMGWGPMSDPEILKKIVIWQDNRFYLSRWSDRTVEWDKLYSCIKNIHSIPIDDNIREEIANLNPNDIIRLEGTLVRAYNKKGDSIVSSTIYSDTGGGSCQICVIKKITKLSDA